MRLTGTDFRFSTDPPSSAQFWWNIIQGTTIAGFGAFVAWRQLRNAEYKTKLDLFDRRYAVYESVINRIDAYARSESPDGGDMITFLRDAIWKSQFLFDQPVTDVLNQLYEQLLYAEEAAYQRVHPSKEFLELPNASELMQEELQKYRGRKFCLVNGVNELGPAVLPYLSFRRVGLKSRLPERIATLARKLKAEADSMM